MRSVAILGNIGSGKSELAEALAQALGWKYVSEPVERWISGGFMKAYYEDPERYAFSFQCYAFITRRKSYAEAGPADRVYDSHVVSDRVFMRMHVARGTMTQREADWYEEIYAGWESEGEPCEPDLYVYLDAPPETCLKRVLEDRKREEEMSIPIEYMRGLASEYDSLVADLGDAVERVDASRPSEEVLERVLEICESRFSV